MHNNVSGATASAAGSDSEDGFGVMPRLMLGMALIALLVFGFGGWAATAELSGAIIAPGQVVVDRHVKKIQHRDGGIVASINVRNGDAVELGDVLVRLDDTQLKAELGILRSQLAQMIGRKARLEAERDNQPAAAFPVELEAMGPEAATVLTGEARLFTDNRATRESKKQQLGLRVTQLEDEIRGLGAQREAKASELVLIEKELVQIRNLHKRKLTPVSRVYSMEREAQRLAGEKGGLDANIARSHGQISEIRLQILAVDQTISSDAQQQLREIDARMAEIRERIVAAEDRLQRIELRAPLSGLVHELNVHTIGGVISPAEPVMLIVPRNDDLAIEVRLAPNDIDQVYIGQATRLRFSAFNQRVTPEIAGQISQISADVTLDPASGQSFYRARVGVAPETLALLHNAALLPGMPVEAFITTQSRTALSFLTKPFSDQFNRAMREE